MTLCAQQLKPDTVFSVSGLPFSAQILWLAETVIRTKSPCIHIMLHDKELETALDALHFFAPDLRVLSFPAWDCLPYDRVSPSQLCSATRLKTLSELYELGQSNTPYLLLTTLNAVTQKILPRQSMSHVSIAIRKRQNINHEQLTISLIAQGYQRVSKVMEAGEYAIRGSIIDIFPAGEETAVRLDLFGNDIESIKRFDPLTQISTESIESCKLHPNSEIFINPETIDCFRTNYRELFGLSSKQDPLYQSISEARTYAGAEHWLPLFYDRLESIFDYMPHAFVAMDSAFNQALIERAQEIEDYYQARKQQESDRAEQAVYHPIAPQSLYIDTQNMASILEKRSRIECSRFNQTPSHAIAIPHDVSPVVSLYHQRHVEQNSVAKTIADYVVKQPCVSVFACNSKGSLERLSHMFAQHHVTTKAIAFWHDAITLQPHEVALAVLPIEQGFTMPGVRIFSEQDALGERIIRTQKRRKKSEAFLAEAASFSVGEYVVHREHGIAKFEGLVTLEISNTQHDCLKLIYAGDDRLFLPVENIDLITRYGSTDGIVELDKLGGVGWQKRKAILKNRLKMAADALLKIAALRATHVGTKIEPDIASFQEFTARFPYTETEDQMQSIEDVLSDMRSGKPMDRLICGDVGFGKTEIAMRAAFAAVASPEKLQVAIIAPTTLLARQHFLNFCERFKGFPIQVKRLSRFVSATEARTTKAGLASGEVDIVIGTHALLAKDIAFKNLGLMIIDEEQHFGVAQKERLKNLKANVHVLTLSATPIPRTLQMALTGVRELSLITTPPVDRLAVRTTIMPYDGVVLREAMMREYHRGGKVFYVTPRVKYMPEILQKLQTLVPELKICAAHGQMTASELDGIMNDFYDGKYDVLLSTAIIESGIDIPTANTMIIDHAELFGLSQLYQLRGRVGRSKTRAYAYFTLPHHKTLSHDATRRLEVMQQLDSLGAGFALASHDMDIRGFGNVLGEEQSGHIKEVGIELYQAMLEEAITEQKRKTGEPLGEDTLNDWSPTINIGSSVLIPEHYVDDLSLRLGLYRRASQLSTEHDIEAFAAELVDRFGSLPNEVEHFIEILRIKLLCKMLGIERIDAGPKGAVMSFRNNQFAKPEALISYIHAHKHSLKIRSDQKLVAMHDWQDAKKRIKGVESTLRAIAAIAA